MRLINLDNVDKITYNEKDYMYIEFNRGVAEYEAKNAEEIEQLKTGYQMIISSMSRTHHRKVSQRGTSCSCHHRFHKERSRYCIFL